VELLKILAKEWWKISPEFITAGENFRNEISGTNAGLVIGDRALEQRKISIYKYDLGLEWKKFTGLPFVFAAWISNKKLDPRFISSFNASNYEGLQHIDKVVEENETGLFDLTLYYTLYIRYRLDEKAKEGLQLFLQKLAQAKDRQGHN
jgi:chorismate dehydratase